VVVGTSFGALAGAAVLAHEMDVASVIRHVVAYVKGAQFRRSQINFFRRRRDIEQTGLLYSLKDLIRRGIYYGFSMTKASFVPPEEFRASIDHVVPERDIASLPARFAAVAADVHTGEEVLLDRGSLRLAVRASCAIPGVMPPVKLRGGRTLIDGGWVNKVPVEPCLALGADAVIAVDVSDDLADTVDLTTGLNVVIRGDAIKSHRLKMIQLGRADVVVHCPVASVHWADFPRVEEIIDLGRRAGRDALPAIDSLLERLRAPGTVVRRAAEAAMGALGATQRPRPSVLTLAAEAEPEVSLLAGDDPRPSTG
jgi:NTE family protein